MGVFEQPVRSEALKQHYNPPPVHAAFPIRYFDEPGLPRLAA